MSHSNIIVVVVVVVEVLLFTSWLQGMFKASQINDPWQPWEYLQTPTQYQQKYQNSRMHFDGLAQDCDISNGLAMKFVEVLRQSMKPIYR